MDFETALMHYRDGSCTEEERLLVEEELKKSQLIAEYLDGQWEDFQPEQEISQTEFRKVKNGLRRRNVTMILTSLILVLAILAGIVKFAIPAVEAQYWDPSVSAYSDEFTDLEFSLRTYSELFVPGQMVSGVRSVKTGFASYDLSVTLAVSRDRYRFEQYSANLVRGELVLPENMWDHPETRSFLLDGEAGNTDGAEKVLLRLPEYMMVRAYVTFPEDLDMEGVMALFRRVGSVELEIPGTVDWIGIRVQKDGEDIYPLCGMKPFWARDASRLGNINEFYSCYSFLDVREPEGSSVRLEKHFKSLLQYSMDRAEQGSGIYPDSSLGDAYYREVMEYVEENGIYAYGCSVTVTPQFLLELISDGTVSAVSLQDSWIALR